jgi:hypothetical protein
MRKGPAGDNEELAGLEVECGDDRAMITKLPRTWRALVDNLAGNQPQCQLFARENVVVLPGFAASAVPVCLHMTAFPAFLTRAPFESRTLVPGCMSQINESVDLKPIEEIAVNGPVRWVQLCAAIQVAPYDETLTLTAIKKRVQVGKVPMYRGVCIALVNQSIQTCDCDRGVVWKLDQRSNRSSRKRSLEIVLASTGTSLPLSNLSDRGSETDDCGGPLPCFSDSIPFPDHLSDTTWWDRLLEQSDVRPNDLSEPLPRGFSRDFTPSPIVHVPSRDSEFWHRVEMS